MYLGRERGEPERNDPDTIAVFLRVERDGEGSGMVYEVALLKG